MHPHPFLAVSAALALVAAPSAVRPFVVRGAVRGAEWRSLEVDGRAPLAYRVVVPDGETTTPRPVLLALPPGGQDRSMVERALELYFEAEARARGWVVVSPAAPEGTSFHDGGEAWIGPLVDALEAELAVEGRVHLAGVSNGGRSAFRVAELLPDRFASLSVLPGAAGADTRVADLARLPVTMFVGADDAPWLEGARETERRLVERGARDVRLAVVEGGHLIDPAVAVDLFDRLDELRALERQREAERREVSDVLAALHAAAATADGERYFDLFAPGAVFLGTDATERWTMPEFRAFAEPYFEGDAAWTYEPLERHVELGPGGTVAWFDERLTNASYGETRGSGVLVRSGDRWRIAQYVLSFPIPNDVAEQVVELVR